MLFVDVCDRLVFRSGTSLKNARLRRSELLPRHNVYYAHFGGLFVLGFGVAKKNVATAPGRV